MYRRCGFKAAKELLWNILLAQNVKCALICAWNFLHCRKWNEIHPPPQRSHTPEAYITPQSGISPTWKVDFTEKRTCESKCVFLGGVREIWTLARFLHAYSLSRGAPSASWVSLQVECREEKLAERVGFEPTAHCCVTGFQDQLLKPLGHLSINILPVLPKK